MCFEDKVLVTGAGGFVGKKLSAELVRQGYIVDALVRKYPTEEQNVKEVNYIIGDIVALDKTKDDLADRYRYIFHLAWQGVQHEQKESFLIQLENIRSTNHFMEFLDGDRIGKLIILGSASEYDALEDEITGKNFPEVSDMYGFAKAATRCLIEMWCRKKGITYNYILASSIYGPGREDDNLISYTITQLLQDKRPSYTPLEQIWNYIYIDDLIRGIVHVAEKGKKDMIYPIGDIENKPLYYYVNTIRNIMRSGIELGIGDLPYKSKKLDNLKINMEKTCFDTGFRPEKTFEEGILETIKYFMLKRSSEIC